MSLRTEGLRQLGGRAYAVAVAVIRSMTFVALVYIIAIVWYGSPEDPASWAPLGTYFMAMGGTAMLKQGPNIMERYRGSYTPTIRPTIRDERD